LATPKILEGKETKVFMKLQPKHGILIIGDSDLTAYAERLSDNLGHCFNVTGYVKPNADFRHHYDHS
jgi:hypothetical protein